MDPDLRLQIDTRQKILSRLRSALIDQLRLTQLADELDPDTPLFGSGLAMDSLDAVEIVVLLETEFGIQLAAGGASPADLRTLNTIVNLVIASGGRA